jgi:hypothetical protein
MKALLVAAARADAGAETTNPIDGEWSEDEPS